MTPDPIILEGHVVSVSSDLTATFWAAGGGFLDDVDVHPGWAVEQKIRLTIEAIDKEMPA